MPETTMKLVHIIFREEGERECEGNGEEGEREGEGNGEEKG